jgi:hypothetical protein
VLLGEGVLFAGTQELLGEGVLWAKIQGEGFVEAHLGGRCPRKEGLDHGAGGLGLGLDGPREQGDCQQVNQDGRRQPCPWTR